MTVKELSQLYWLRKEIERDERRLEELRATIYNPSGGSAAGGHVQGGKVESKIERMAAEIVDLEAIITARYIQCAHERNRLERYISTIEDSLIRQIITLRFVDGLAWYQVAQQIGGNTEDSVKKMCYRFLKKNGREE